MKELILLTSILCLFSLNTRADVESYDKYDYHYGNNNGCSQVYDPYEKLNRKIFAFNSVLDYFILRPVTIGYKKITNNYTKARVGSFLDNINMPLTVVNYGLQVNYDQTMKSLWRFIINSTFGIAGLFDVASKIGLNPARQTFGSSLAHYGVGPGPYLVIPFFGGTNARDMTDSLFSNNLLNPINYVVHKDFKIIVTAVQMIDTRLGLLPFTDFVTHNSTDPYLAIRSAIHQNRESVVIYSKDFKCPKPN